LSVEKRIIHSNYKINAPVDGFKIKLHYDLIGQYKLMSRAAVV